MVIIFIKMINKTKKDKHVDFFKAENYIRCATGQASSGLGSILVQKANKF